MFARRLLLLGVLSLLLLGVDCEDCDDWNDDDDASDDDDVVPDDDDATDDDDVTPPEPFVVSGEVVALDRDTGVVLTLAEYNARSGGIIVYAVPDADDISVIHDKDTLIDGPGDFEIPLDVVGPFHMVAIADSDKNFFITDADILREYAFNPLAGAGQDIEDVVVYIDIPMPQGDDDDDDDDTGPGDDDDDGGPGDDDDDDDDDTGPGDDDDAWVCVNTVLAGEVTIFDLPEEMVGVSTNTVDLASGPLEWMTRDGSGPWDFLLPCEGDRALLAYLDADANMFFEPSDPIGVAEGNPFVLGIGDVYNIQIDIPAQEEVEIPAPISYVPILGTVAYGGFTTGDILVHASYVTTDGYLFSMATLAAPGGFSIIAPGDTDNVLVWAVLDADGDGAYDLSSDPFDYHGPVNTGTGLSGIFLDLGEVPLGSISGTVTYPASVSAGDELHVGLFDTATYDPASGPPLQSVVVPAGGFPFAYDFTDLEPDTYWVGAYLDLGGDDPTDAGPEDPEAQVGPLLLAPGEDMTNIEVPLPEPS